MTSKQRDKKWFKEGGPFSKINKLSSDLGMLNNIGFISLDLDISNILHNNLWNLFETEGDTVCMPDETSWKEKEEMRLHAMKLKCSAREGVYCNISKTLCNPPEKCFKLECKEKQ